MRRTTGSVVSIDVMAFMGKVARFLLAAVLSKDFAKIFVTERLFMCLFMTGYVNCVNKPLTNCES
jgi:hypothetical protein